MTIGSKNHHAAIIRTNVSQASRDAARQPEFPRFDSHHDEIVYLKRQMIQVEAELAGYSDTAFQQEHQRILRNGLGAGKWIDRKADMENAKTLIVQRKRRIEARLSEVKSLAAKDREFAAAEMRKRIRQQAEKNGKAMDDEPFVQLDGRIDYGLLGVEILNELRAIRKSLIEKSPRENEHT